MTWSRAGPYRKGRGQKRGGTATEESDQGEKENAEEEEGVSTDPAK